MARFVALLRQLSWIIVGIALLFAVYLLPPDTSLAEVRSDGRLTVCVPSERLPLITGDPARPGLEAELLAGIAKQVGVALQFNVIASMGQDFNPQSWRITRAQCAIVAGGLVDSIQTRSFLEISPSYARTGWVAIAPGAVPDLKGRTVGVLANVQGFDRIALARYLRDRGATIRLVRSADELAAGLGNGTLEVGISESLIGEQLAAGRHWTTQSLSPPLESYPLVFGLWKGDLTLKRAVVDAFDRLEADGEAAAILARYGVRASPAG